MTVRALATRLLWFVIPAVGLYLVAVRTPAGQRVDSDSFAAVARLNKWDVPAGVIRERLPAVLVVVVLVLTVICLWQRRLRDAVAALLLVVIGVPLSQVLRNVVLERPDLGAFGYTYNTFPSGHTVVFGSLLLAVLFLVPPTLRTPRLAVGLGSTTVVAAFASVVSFAHRPSDVVAGLLIVGASCVASVLVSGADLLLPRPPARWRATRIATVVAVVSYALVLVDPPVDWVTTLLGNVGALSAMVAATCAIYEGVRLDVAVPAGSRRAFDQAS